MTTASARWGTQDLVPLADRMRYLQWYRLGATCVILLFAALAPRVLDGQPRQLAVAAAGYLAVSSVSTWLWTRSRRRGLALFGAMLIGDGLFLAWLTQATGQTASALQPLIALHLITVALLASYRTSLKLAFWHALLQIVLYHYGEAGFLETSGTAGLPGTGFERVVAFVTLLWLVAIATASFSALNERELRRRRFDLEGLARFAGRLDGIHDPRVVAEVLVEDVADVFGPQRILVLSRRSEEWVVLAAHGCAVDGPPPTTLPADSLIARTLALQASLPVAGLHPQADRWLADVMPEAGNLLLVPLFEDGVACGVLIAEHGLRMGSRIERRVLAMFERFTAHAGLALRNAWLVQELHARAVTDGLTSIANRRAFDAALAREVDRAARNDEEVSLIMIDLDYFKALNDTHGHQAGDDVLRAVATTLEAECRSFDTAARYGGEEFAVILPRCSAEGALGIGERLRRSIQGAATTVPITASLGIASFPVHAAEPVGLVAAADEALYVSKQTGRDRATVSMRQAVDVPTTPQVLSTAESRP